MTRRTSQLSFANRAICIVLSALLAITMMPAAAFAAMGEYADSGAGAQQQSASEFTGSEDQSQQEQPAGESADAENVPPGDNSSAASQGNLSMQDEDEGEQSGEAADESKEQPNPVDALLDVQPADLDGEYVSDEVIIVYEGDMPDKAEPVSIDSASEAAYAIAELAEGVGGETASTAPESLEVTLEEIGVTEQEIIVEDADIPASNAKSFTDGNVTTTGDIALAKLDADTSVEEAVARLECVEGVAYVQPNYVYKLAEYDGVQTDDADGMSASNAFESQSAEYATSSTTTSDPRLSEQYYLTSTRARDAWDYSRASNKVTVAVVDSGCNLDHPDLQGNLLSSLAWDCINNKKLSETKASIGYGGDSLGHGTMVSGVIAAKANNGAGIAGVSYDANVLPLRVFSSENKTSTRYIVNALGKIEEYISGRYVSNLKVVNLSLGGYTDDPTFHSWIQKLRNTYGITFVCSGGNGDESTHTPITAPCYPSDYEECISVTSLTKAGAHSTWCDYNASKDISAPGEQILTTNKEGGYGYTQGTSFSAPIVSGVAALMFATKPNATPQNIYNALRSGAGSISGTANPGNGSAGAVDAVGALNALTLKLTVSYDHDIKCGTNTKFTINATGGSGQYKYMFDTLYLADEDYYYIKDPSRGKGYVMSPEFEFEFTASGTYYGYFYVMDTASRPIQTERVIETIVVNDPNYPTVAEVANRVAKECLDAGNTTDYDKALWLHDWLIDNCEYDNSLLYCNWEGALTRGLGTCEAYHRAYCALLERVGVDSGRVTGNGHVWTAVKMDGKWYQVDVTWDDYPTFEGYPNLTRMQFGLNDKLMGLVHSDHSGPAEPYVSDSLECNYFIKSGEIHDYSDTLLAQAKQKAEQGSMNFALPVQTTGWAATKLYRDIIYTLVAYEFTQNCIVVDTPIRRVLSVVYDANSSTLKFMPDTMRGLIRSANGYVFIKSDGNFARSEWVTTGGKTYFFEGSFYNASGRRYLWRNQYNYFYFGEDGAMMTSTWANGRYYGQDGREAANGWLQLGAFTYFIRETGLPAKGEAYLWTGAGYHFYHFDDNDGHMIRSARVGEKYYDANGWLVAFAWYQHAGKTYFANADGTVRKGEAYLWTHAGYRHYYFDETDGHMVANDRVGDKYYDANGWLVAFAWYQHAGKTYFAEPDGMPRKGASYLWTADGYHYYYFDDDDGHMLTSVTKAGRFYGANGWGLEPGWATIAGQTYFMDADGTPRRGEAYLWTGAGYHFYHFDDNDGHMIRSARVGEKYYDANGWLVAFAWYQHAGKTYFANADGTVRKGEAYLWTDTGYHHYSFDESDGRMARSTFVDGRYYDANGWRATFGWLGIGGRTYFANADGTVRKGEAYLWTGAGYHFYHFDDNDGHMIRSARVGEKYYDANGWLVAFAWYQHAGKTYFANADGTVRKGEAYLWTDAGYHHYYFDESDGRMAVNEVVNGRFYDVNGWRVG